MHHPIDKTEAGLCVMSGLLMTAAFPNIGLFPAPWVALVPLLIGITRQSPFNGFRLGILAGLVHYVTLMYWLAYTMHTYGHLPWALSVPIMLLLAFYLSLFIGVFCAILSGTGGQSRINILLIPFLWVLLEYLRSFLLSGFPWALLGYSQSENLYLIQISDITGVYGVSFLIVAINGAFFALYCRFSNQNHRRYGVSLPFVGVCLIAAAALTGGVLFYGQNRIDRISEWMDASPRMNVVAVQGNIDQAAKWDRRFQIATTQKYVDLSLSAASENTDLVVWPETATPFYFSYDRDPETRSLNRMVIDGITVSDCNFLIGSPSFSYNDGHIEYFNSAYLVHPDGRIADKYDKVHLVPFGEYVPFKKWIPFIGKIVEHVGDFEGGKKGKTLSRGTDRLGVLICFEIIFPELSRAVTKNGASLLLNLTNDAWYGRTGAPHQHFAMAVFRAVENRRSLVRSANTGISGFIDPMGAPHGKTGLYEDATASFSVPLVLKKSFYTVYGDLFAWGCGVIAVVLMIRRLFALKRPTRS
jgi:apolipoprotein N-acyltransferase